MASEEKKRPVFRDNTHECTPQNVQNKWDEFTQKLYAQNVAKIGLGAGARTGRHRETDEDKKRKQEQEVRDLEDQLEQLQISSHSKDRRTTKLSQIKTEFNVSSRGQYVAPHTKAEVRALSSSSPALTQGFHFISAALAAEIKEHIFSLIEKDVETSYEFAGQDLLIVVVLELHDNKLQRHVHLFAQPKTVESMFARSGLAKKEDVTPALAETVVEYLSRALTLFMEQVTNEVQAKRLGKHGGHYTLTAQVTKTDLKAAIATSFSVQDLANKAREGVMTVVTSISSVDPTNPLIHQHAERLIATGASEGLLDSLRSYFSGTKKTKLDYLPPDGFVLQKEVQDHNIPTANLIVSMTAYNKAVERLNAQLAAEEVEWLTMMTKLQGPLTEYKLADQALAREDELFLLATTPFAKDLEDSRNRAKGREKIRVANVEVAANGQRAVAIEMNIYTLKAEIDKARDECAPAKNDQKIIIDAAKTEIEHQRQKLATAEQLLKRAEDKCGNDIQMALLKFQQTNNLDPTVMNALKKQLKL